MTRAFLIRAKARALFAVLCVTVLVNGCGGGTDEPAARTVAADGSASALAISAKAPESATSTETLSVLSLTKVGEKRVSRTVFDYVFRIAVRNNSEALVAVTATVTAAGQGTTIVDGDVLVGDMPAAATITPTDTITLRHDRAFPFNPSALVWRLRAVPAVPAMVPGADLSNFPAGRATVGSPYEATLRLSPVDPRNAIVSLEVSNPTPGGARPGITLQGLLTWTPNEADFAASTLHLTARLQDGSSSEFDLPVTVTKYRLVANVVLNGAGRYSDPEGRYLVDVSSALPGASVTGVLSISERYQLNGAYSNVITSSDSRHVIEVITAPMGVPFGAGEAIEGAKSRQRALALAGGRQRPSESDPQFSADPESTMGSKVDAGINNVYTTRQGVPGFDNVVVARIESNCSLPCNSMRLATATPVILVHGYKAEVSGLGGGKDTWGTLGSKLDGLGHPVYELRWRTQMRFEEAAGLLVKLAQRVSDGTGRKPFIIAHSFGGVVAHLALAGKAIGWNDGTKK